jgi:hypothetical protein
LAESSNFTSVLLWHIILGQNFERKNAFEQKNLVMLAFSMSFKLFSQTEPTIRGIVRAVTK